MKKKQEDGLRRRLITKWQGKTHQVHSIYSFHSKSTWKSMSQSQPIWAEVTYPQLCSSPVTRAATGEASGDEPHDQWSHNGPTGINGDQHGGTVGWLGHLRSQTVKEQNHLEASVWTMSDMIYPKNPINWNRKTQHQ